MPHLTRLSRAVTATAALAATTLAGVESARAGTYVIRNCNVPGYGAAPVGPWQSTPTANTVAFNQCASGGGFGFSVSAPGSAIAYLSRSAIDLTLPTDGPGSAIRLRSVRAWLIARLTGQRTALDIVSYVTDTDRSTRMTNYIFPPGKDYSTQPYVSTVSANSTTMTFEVALACLAMPSDRPTSRATTFESCFPDSETPLDVHGIETTFSEDVPPSATAISGTLLSGGPVANVVGLRYAVSDGESGLRSVELRVGGALVAEKAYDGDCSYTEITPCPSNADGEFSLDTRQLADGDYPVALRVSDAAGNQRDVPVRTVSVRNTGGATSGPIGVTDPGTEARLTAGFSGSSRPTLIASYGRKVVIRGKLTGAATHAIGDAVVDVVQKTTVAGAVEKAVGHVTTRADGTFSYVMVVRGPSRTLRLAYHRTPGDPAPASSPALDLKVRAASTLRVSLHGVTVRFDGQVLSRPIPKAGKRVLLQGKAPGFAWAPFATVRSDRRGRFAGSYRLPVHRPGVRLQIRAVLPVERGYPYLGHSGQPVTVRVR